MRIATEGHLTHNPLEPPMTRSSPPASLHAGDRVTWQTPQGSTEGTVVKKVTRATHVKGHAVKASSEAPQYEVESRKTGRHAVHQPQALKRVKP
jgi:hypothetical protein